MADTEMSNDDLVASLLLERTGRAVAEEALRREREERTRECLMLQFLHEQASQVRVTQLRIMEARAVYTEQTLRAQSEQIAAMEERLDRQKGTLLKLESLVRKVR